MERFRAVSAFFKLFSRKAKTNLPKHKADLCRRCGGVLVAPGRPSPCNQNECGRP